jgi:hypothetical protein
VFLNKALMRYPFQRITMYIWFPYKTSDLSDCQYIAPFPKVYTHMISYSFPNAANQRATDREVLLHSPVRFNLG